MFLQSKLFRFLLPLTAFLLFSGLWLIHFSDAWYGARPEETVYFRKPHPYSYIISGYLLAALFAVHVIAGIFYVVGKNPRPVLRYVLAINLFLAAYILWAYTLTFQEARAHSALLFLDLCLFGASIMPLLKGVES
jgi:hypothetical protein